MAEFYAQSTQSMQESGQGLGQTMAYNQPAMARVIQAAGRLVRSPNDRGIICLVDPRFQQVELQSFFPSYWRPQTITLKEVKSSVNSFWSHDMSPRED